MGRLPAFLVRSLTVPHTGHIIEGLIIPGSPDVSVCVSHTRSKQKIMIYSEDEMESLPKVVKYNINIIKTELLELIEELKGECIHGTYS